MAASAEICETLEKTLELQTICAECGQQALGCKCPGGRSTRKRRAPSWLGNAIDQSTRRTTTQPAKRPRQAASAHTHASASAYASATKPAATPQEPAELELDPELAELADLADFDPENPPPPIADPELELERVASAACDVPSTPADLQEIALLAATVQNTGELQHLMPTEEVEAFFASLQGDQD